MYFPIRIKFTRKCKRCGLRYAEQEPVCPHCNGLSDEQVRRIKLRHNNMLAGNENLGRLLMYIAGLIIVGMVIFMLNK